MASGTLLKTPVIYEYVTITITDGTNHLGTAPSKAGYRAIACQSWQNAYTVGTRQVGNNLEVKFSSGALNDKIGCYVTYVAVT